MQILNNMSTVKKKKKYIIYLLNIFFSRSIALAVFSVKVRTAVYRFPLLSLSIAVPCTDFVNQHQIEFDVISIAMPYSG
jgi:hypothetical protein